MSATDSGSSDVKVSVAMITYNHERFITQAIESVLMQEIDFEYELVIGEDCSTDGTRDIVVEYARQYPERIRLLLPEHNLGMMFNFVATLEACSGQYVALLEGDDYWTDPYKLQKQVEFLEGHPEYVICHHDAMIVGEQGRTIKDSKLPHGLKRDFSADELATGAWILTLTACFRNVLLEYPPECFKVLNGDTFLFSLLGNHGKSKYLGDSITPDTYRVHTGGIWSSQTSDWEKANHSFTTYYWLRAYYWRIGKKKYSQSFARVLHYATILYRLPGPTQVEDRFNDHLQRFEQALTTSVGKTDDTVSIRSCQTANLYMGAAFANFRWQQWERGCNYLERAIELDPVAWHDEDAMVKVLIKQGILIQELSGGWDTTRICNYAREIRHHLSQRIHVAWGLFRIVEGRLYAEAAYRSYLAADHKGVQHFTWHALRADPFLFKDVGMLRRALQNESNKPK